jgi:hypothetical protein
VSLTVDGLTFRYAIEQLAPGKLPFRRWRWELWHGARLEAAGWRVSERDACRALWLHASRVGHRLFGLSMPDDDGWSMPQFRPGAAVRGRHGAVDFVLAPRELEVRSAWPSLT